MYIISVMRLRSHLKWSGLQFKSHLPKHPALGPDPLALCVCKVCIILPEGREQHMLNSKQGSVVSMYNRFAELTLCEKNQLKRSTSEFKVCPRTSRSAPWWCQRTGSDTSSERDSQERQICAWGRMCSTLSAVRERGKRETEENKEDCVWKLHYASHSFICA